MILKDITITDFKSIYGTQHFVFSELEGLVKLSGVVGVGKTTLGEAILWGLFGAVKGQNNKELIAWNTRACEVEINLISKNKEVHIKRNIYEPLIVEINGKVLSASNKKNTQAILEEEIYDVPKLAITKMCVISFNAFNSLASMNAGETKQFLDEILGFKLFSQFNDEIVNERRTQISESVKLNAIYQENLNQTQRLREKKAEQQAELSGNIDLESLNARREKLVSEGKELRNKFNDEEKDFNRLVYDNEQKRLVYYNKKMEYATLGRQEKEWYNKFKTGVCPTCGNKINDTVIEDHHNKMLEYAALYKEQDALETGVANEKKQIQQDHRAKSDAITQQMNDLRQSITAIDNEIKIYNNNVQLINDNYDELISEYENKTATVKEQLDRVEREIGEWNEMNELFTKTLRYNLLETLIPHINKSIKHFINKLDQSYKIEYDQEFKPHIYVDSFDKEISYNNLSTGQRKSLDIAIIFGIMQNIIASVDFNVFFLDELFSNLDSDSRNVMLSLLNETMADGRTIFVINHAEMNDDYFAHKIRVTLENRKLSTRKVGDVVVKASTYKKVF